ncbi:hypothetical protein FBU30_010611 [Linnemannia zychae]|nr:hypothetical protein FBU30_010611 [Linnemannia zychae]
MFSWIKSPELPDTIETQAFRSISGGPILRINTINDRTHRMKLVPWEDILEVFPNAIYLRDANGIVMPARDNMLKRITPKSIKLQPDVVLEVVSTQDVPPRNARPENIATPTDDNSNNTNNANELSVSTIPRRSSEHPLDHYYHPHLPTTASPQSSIRASSESKHSSKKSTESVRKHSHESAASHSNNHGQEEDDDWAPFQANSSSGPSSSTHTIKPELVDSGSLLAGLTGISNELLRQEIIHRFELLSAEQEERLNVILQACRTRPPR